MTSIDQILTHFRQVDPILYEVAIQSDPQNVLRIQTSNNYFARLCEAIISQQLSVKAASSIWRRFLALFELESVDLLTPSHVIGANSQQLRAVGLSFAKIKYIHGLAQALLSGDCELNDLDQAPDQEVIDRLMKLKGIGLWTAQMFLMFTLGREDQFSVGDLGLKRAIERLYKIPEIKPSNLLSLSQVWSPYRTYACLILWNSLDNQPIS